MPTRITCIGLAALALALARPAVAQDTSDPQLAAVEKLIADYRVAHAAVIKQIRATESTEEREAIWEKRPSKTELWAPQFWKIVDSAPKSEAGFRALMWIRSRVASVEEGDRTVTLLLEHHMRHEGLGPVAKRYVGAPAPTTRPFAEKVMRRVIAGSPHAKVRGETSFYLARWLRHNKPETNAAEIITFLELTIKACKDVPGTFPYQNRSLSEVADAELFRLRFLQVGKKAPDISGEDVAGVAFKLSEYRGKVILLDFWGHW